MVRRVANRGRISDLFRHHDAGLPLVGNSGFARTSTHDAL